MDPRRRTPENDDDQLYGRENELVETHGSDDPGPDDGQFPAPSDRQPAGTESPGPGSEEAHREPVRRRQSQEGGRDERRP